MNDAKRIVILTRVLPHHAIGGMQAVAWDLALAFVAKGHSVTVVTAQIEGRPSTFNDAGINVIALPGTSWRFYGRRWWKGSFDVSAQLLAEGHEVVLSVSAAGNSALRLRHRYPDVCFVMQAHGTSIGEIRSKWKSRRPKALISSIRNCFWLFKDLWFYRRFDTVVAIGAAVATDLKSAPVRWALNRERILTISNGIDTQLFRPSMVAGMAVRARLGWDEQSLVIVCASRLHRQKGTHLALSSFALLAETDRRARMLIVGDGPELDALKSLAKELNVSDVIHFAGRLSREELPSYLQAADVMFFPTLRIEGLPLNVLEALSCGLKVVVSRHVFAGHDLAELDDVCLVDPKDIQACAHAAHQASLHFAERRNLLPEAYSLSTCADSYLSLFERLQGQAAALSRSSC